jgi:N-formylglutamate amidohydrolase
MPCYSVTEGEGPLVAVALHDGHALRPEVAALTALPEEERLREEDPFTAAWTAVAPTRLVALRSRFEVDLNRPRAKAVYRRPADAWGLPLWRRDPPDELVERSLSQHDAFYAEARRVLDGIAAREGRFVVLDLHSYNHHRAGPDAPFEPQSTHPDVNIGTGSMDRARWARIVDRLMAELSGCDDLGRRLDVRENVKFQGGAFVRWVHETYPEVGCAVAMEHKKFFMDEWTGELYPAVHAGILRLLRSAAAAVREELAAQAWAVAAPSTPRSGRA